MSNSDVVLFHITAPLVLTYQVTLKQSKYLLMIALLRTVD
jgi:hypothetical protein